jgi:hypothetical protein
MRNDERRAAGQNEPPKSKGCLSVLLALLLAGLVFAVLFVLTQGRVLVAALVAGVIFGMAALQWVLWGWWLSGFIHQQVEDEEQV